MEVESALVDHQKVAESAVIGKAHEIKGQAICAFVSLKAGVDGSADLVDELKSHVAKKIGPSRGRTRFSLPRSCPKPATVRSCAGCSVTSPTGACWAIRRLWLIRRSWQS